MSPFEREVIDHYRRHRRAAEILAADNLLIDTRGIELSLSRRFAQIEVDHEQHAAEAEDTMLEIDRIYKHRDIAQQKYQANIDKASAHKDLHFEKYIEMALQELDQRGPTAK